MNEEQTNNEILAEQVTRLTEENRKLKAKSPFILFEKNWLSNEDNVMASVLFVICIAIVSLIFCAATASPSGHFYVDGSKRKACVVKEISWGTDESMECFASRKDAYENAEYHFEQWGKMQEMNSSR